MSEVQVYLESSVSKERCRRMSYGRSRMSHGNFLPRFPSNFLTSLNYRKFDYFPSEIYMHYIHVSERCMRIVLEILCYKPHHE